MRMIDADATKRRVADTFFDTLIPCVNRALDDSPTIDAVPVVRCRECDYGSESGDLISCGHPEYDLMEGVLAHEEGFYCGYGKRKEGADNG